MVCIFILHLEASGAILFLPSRSLKFIYEQTNIHSLIVLFYSQNSILSFHKKLFYGVNQGEALNNIYKKHFKKIYNPFLVILTFKLTLNLQIPCPFCPKKGIKVQSCGPSIAYIASLFTPHLQIFRDNFLFQLLLLSVLMKNLFCYQVICKTSIMR